VLEAYDGDGQQVTPQASAAAILQYLHAHKIM
jgi:hypothetical protein